MKRLGIVSLASLAFLLVCSAFAYFMRYVPLSDPWWYLVIGLLLLAVSGVAALLGRRFFAFNAVCFLVSAVALGACIRAWYIFRGFDNPLWLMVLVSVFATLYLTLFFLISRIPIFARHSATFVILFLVFSLAAYITVVFTTKTTYVSTFGYYMLIELAFVIAVYTEPATGRDLLRTLALSTFSVFGVIVFIAVMLLIALAGGDCDLDGDCCELCECLDGCDIFDTGRAKGRKKK